MIINMTRRVMLAAGVVALLLGGLGAVVGADEQRLTQQQIEQVLSGNTAVGSFGSTTYRQYFAPDGETLYVPDGGQPDPGKWRASEEDEYCSWWSTTDWVCYEMTGEGDHVTWHAKDGSQSPAVIVEGRQIKLSD